MARRRGHLGGIVAAALGTAAMASLAAAAEIHSAAASGDVAALRKLLKKTPDLVKAADAVGRTPLHHAARHGQNKAAELLLASGADHSARDAAGWTPLHVAAAAGHVEIAELLLAKGAEVDPKDVRGRTPLNRAVRGDHRPMTEFLIKRGATASVGVPEKGQIERLIRDLGDESWHKREDAHKRLIEFGFFALDAVKQAVSSEDNEVVWRAKDILAKLEKSTQLRVIPTDFWVVGPFAHPQGKEPLETVYPPETAYAADKTDLNAVFKDGEREASWSRPWPGEEGKSVDLDVPWKNQTNTVAYSLTWVFCPEERPVVMLLGSDDSVKVWIERELVHKNDVRRAVNIDEDKVEVTLPAGWSRLFIKVVEYAGEWGFAVRFVDSEGAQPADIIFDPTRGGAVKGPEPKPKPPEERRPDADGGERPAAPPANGIRINFGGG